MWENDGRLTPQRTAASGRTAITIAAVLANVLLLLLTCVLLWAEGPSKGSGYVTLTVLMVAVPVLSAATILRGGPSNWLRSRVKAAAAGANVVLLGFLFWAIVAGYPYPEGNSVLAFAAICVLAPILSLAVLLRRGKSLETAM